jgi:hypothetical protein
VRLSFEPPMYIANALAIMFINPFLLSSLA